MRRAENFLMDRSFWSRKIASVCNLLYNAEFILKFLNHTIKAVLLSLEKRFLQRHGWNSVHLDFLRADCWLTRGIFSVREFTEKIHEEEQCYPVRFNERPAHYIRILARLTPPPASFSSSSSSSFLPAAFCSLVLSSRLRLQILWKLSFTFCERMKNRVWISSSLQ